VARKGKAVRGSREKEQRMGTGGGEKDKHNYLPELRGKKLVTGEKKANRAITGRKGE